MDAWAFAVLDDGPGSWRNLIGRPKNFNADKNLARWVSLCHFLSSSHRLVWIQKGRSVAWKADSKFGSIIRLGKVADLCSIDQHKHSDPLV